MTEKRQRGRPKGTCLPDNKSLRDIADLILNDTSLKITQAIDRIQPNRSAATLRRLQRKWKQGSAKYLAEAAGRAAERHREAMDRQTSSHMSGGIGSDGSYDSVTSMLAHIEAATRHLNTPQMRAAQEFANSAHMRALREVDTLAIATATQALRQSSVLQVLQDLENSPAMRAQREAQRLLAFTRPFGGGF